jgi:hypothetical protein
LNRSLPLGDGFVEVFLRLLDIAGHTERVTQLVVQLAQEMGIAGEAGREERDEPEVLR